MAVESAAVFARDAGPRIATWLTYAEDAIYLVTAVLLTATALVLAGSTARNLLRSLRSGPFLTEALKALDSLLLVLMIVELLHTIRFFIVEHALVPEPFLIVALIASVRRLLILTTEASQYIQTEPEKFRMALREMALLTFSFVVIAGAIVVLHRMPS
jgi:uncharacterized membrane protein (DUF373 family)